MTDTSVNFYAYNYREVKTYAVATLFVLGNIALPQLFHLVPNGGIIWLPIYFFTLIGAYKYGWCVGLLTAIASPLINSAIFGMPMPAVLPAILIKSVLLAIGAGFAQKKFRKVSLSLLTGVVVFYQFFGSLAEWAMSGNLQVALQDILMGLPGIGLQIIGGFAFIRYIIRK